MRKLIFLLAAISVLLAACSKDEVIPAVEEEEEEIVTPSVPAAKEVEAILFDVLTAEEFDGKIELVIPGVSQPWRVRIILADRLCFEMELITLGLFLTTFTESQALLNEDQTDETLETVREILGNFNENNTISFSLDDKEAGKVTLDLVKDNETYSADIVMNYYEDGSKYDMNYFYSDYISDIIKKLQELFNRLNKHIE